MNKATAAAVAEAEGGSFELLDPGVYHVRLRDVDPTREGPKGPYWTWEFEVVEPGHSGRLWNNTSLSEAAYFKLKETFDAFDADTDIDTDELLGDICRAKVGIRTIAQGPKKGEEANQIEELLPADEDFDVGDDGDADLDFEGDDGDAGEDDDPEPEPEEKAKPAVRRRRKS